MSDSARGRQLWAVRNRQGEGSLRTGQSGTAKGRRLTLVVRRGSQVLPVVGKLPRGQSGTANGQILTQVVRGGSLVLLVEGGSHRL